LSAQEIVSMPAGPVVDDAVETPEMGVLDPVGEDLLIEEEIIIEDFDIDGICGVY